MLAEAGHQVVALHRKPEQAELIAASGAVPVLGDIMTLTADNYTCMATGCDAIIFSAGAAGSGLDRTTTIDGDAPGKLIQAAKTLGIKRFLVVSAFPEAGRQGEPNPRFEHYMLEKKRADVDVAASGLDWVILRPGTLEHADGDGKISLGLALPYGNVARGNVARVLASLIDHPEINQKILELTDGLTPVEEAINNLDHT